MRALFGPCDSLGALLALESDAWTVLVKVVVDVTHFELSIASDRGALDCVAGTSHCVIDFFLQLELPVAHLARKLHLVELLENEAMHLHVVSDPNSASWTVG